mmetsp:Transcript_69405/g.178894  ORF Transcript_69405/g.178894 Transcript_69405/m.178894 type:complete len:241 (-) Transcript_69405:1507-2229(-)
MHEEERAEVLRLLEAATRQREVALLQRHVAQRLPLAARRHRGVRLCADVDDDVRRHLQLAELCGQLEAVLVVLGDLQRLSSEALVLEEACHAVVQRLGQLLEVGLCRLEVLLHDSGLVLNEGQVERVGRHIQLLVDEVQLRLIGQVAEKVLDAVQVGDGLLGTGHEAEEPLGLGDVDEAVTHPSAAHHLVRQLVHKVESSLDAVFIHRLGAGSRGGHSILVMSEHVKRVGADEHHVQAIL